MNPIVIIIGIKLIPTILQILLSILSNIKPDINNSNITMNSIFALLFFI